MTGSTEQGGAARTRELEEGRYLFCAVRADHAGGTDPASAPASENERLDAPGIEDGDVSLISHGGVAAVVQPVDSLFDSGDPAQVRRWLLAHQQTVDEAGRAYGTPLPFRFDTVVTGGDGAVTEYLETNHEELQEALEWLAGRWEYRIDLRWDETAVGESVRETDEELASLAERAETASEGTGFLLEKQYRQLLSDRLERRRADLRRELRERIEPLAVDVRSTGGRTTGFDASGSSGGSSSGDSRNDGSTAAPPGGSDPEGSASAEDDGTGAFETAVELSVFADADREAEIGEELEPYADRTEYDVRYTGPWPPYTFAPAVGDGGDDGS